MAGPEFRSKSNTVSDQCGKFPTEYEISELGIGVKTHGANLARLHELGSLRAWLGSAQEVHRLKTGVRPGEGQRRGIGPPLTLVEPRQDASCFRIEC